MTKAKGFFIAGMLVAAIAAQAAGLLSLPLTLIFFGLMLLSALPEKAQAAPAPRVEAIDLSPVVESIKQQHDAIALVQQTLMMIIRKAKLDQLPD